MSRKWPVEYAESRFSELLDVALAEGPQIVTRRGVETAMLVPIGQWRAMEGMTRPDLKELLLSPYARTEHLVTARRRYSHRSPVTAEQAMS